MMVMIIMMSGREIYDDRAMMMDAIWKIKIQAIGKVKKLCHGLFGFSFVWKTFCLVTRDALKPFFSE